MSIDSSKHWPPPVIEQDERGDAQRAVFMELRSYLRKTAKRSAEKIIVKYLKPKHVMGLIDIFDEETLTLEPIINYAIHLRNKTERLLTGRNIDIPIDSYVSSDATATIINAIHAPLRERLAHDMVHCFISVQIDALRLQHKRRTPLFIPPDEQLEREVMRSFGEELKIVHEQVFTASVGK